MVFIYIICTEDFSFFFANIRIFVLLFEEINSNNNLMNIYSNEYHIEVNS